MKHSAFIRSILLSGTAILAGLVYLGSRLQDPLQGKYDQVVQISVDPDPDPSFSDICMDGNCSELVIAREKIGSADALERAVVEVAGNPAPILSEDEAQYIDQSRLRIKILRTEADSILNEFMEKHGKTGVRP